MKNLSETLSATIVESVQDVFQAFLFLDASPGPCKIAAEGKPYSSPKSEVTAVIEYGEGLEGGVHLSSPLYVACQLAGALAGMELETLDDEGRDAFGELANMVAGGIQTRLMEDSGFADISLTPPIVVTGDQTAMEYLPDFQSVKQYFKFAGGLFFVECFFLTEGWPRRGLV